MAPQGSALPPAPRVAADLQQDDVVVTGVSGRLPECDNVDQFAEKLFGNVDMVTENDRRYPRGTWGLPHRSGKIGSLAHFDAQFFGVPAKQADNMDPQARVFLETAYEAIVDSGYNPAELRGSRTGVFVAVSSSEMRDWFFQSQDRVQGYLAPGSLRAMMANRVSYAFDFHGPSYAFDAACAVGTSAIQHALMAIRDGQCDAAIVGGSNLLLHPASSLQYFNLGVMSPDGKCKSFDASANGYARSEAVVAVFLQRASAARRMYATLVNAGTSNDGYKEDGITMLSPKQHSVLYARVYAEAGVDPRDVVYAEAHGTGTPVGDPLEVEGLAAVLCKDRTTPLLLGSTRSNIGHAEAAAGVCSLIKLVVAMERGVLPATLHFNNANPSIAALVDGRARVVSENTPWDGGLACFSSFGFGGCNAHAVVRSNPGPRAAPRPTGRRRDGVPRLVVASGRTAYAVRHMLAEARRHDSEEVYGMLANIHRLHVPGHGYRGYALLGDDAEELAVEATFAGQPGRPVWWAFAGLGSQSAGVAAPLMRLPAFAATMQRCAAALRPFGVDLVDLAVNGDAAVLLKPVPAYVSIVATSVALVDVLRGVGLQCDGMFGHSLGELGCAYADGCFTAEQAVLTAYWRAQTFAVAKVPEGAMAAVMLPWEEAVARCPEGIVPACHNSSVSVTVSGLPDAIDRFLEELRAEGVPNRKLESCGVATHSKYIAAVEPYLRKELEALIPDPKSRSARWLSTSVPEMEWGCPRARLCSAEYHVNNVLSPVRMAQTLTHVPEDAVIVEIAPHGLFRYLLQRAIGPKATVIGLLHHDSPDHMNHLLGAIGKTYIAGSQPDVGLLEPPIRYPVSRGTPMLAPMVRWDHSAEWFVPDFYAYETGSDGSVIEAVEVDVSKDADKYLVGHVLNGRSVFPCSGYMELAWRTLAKLRKKSQDELAVVMEDLHFKRADIPLDTGPIKFVVNIADSGAFEVSESGGVLASGRIRAVDEAEVEALLLAKRPARAEPRLKADDVYRELRLRGHEYAGAFQGLTEADIEGCEGKLAWTDNWVTFLDAVLQLGTLGAVSRDATVPARIRRVVVDPRRLQKAAEALAADDGLPVTNRKNLDILQTHGVEIRGIQSVATPRSTNAQAAPLLERHAFVPHRPTGEAAEPFEGVLAAALQIAAENCGASTLRVVELAGEREAEALLAPLLVRIAKEQPKLDAEVAVASAALEALPTELEQQGVRLVRAEASEGPVDESASTHVVVAAGLVTAKGGAIWRHVAKSLVTGGFVLLEEAGPVDVAAATLKRAGLAAVATLQAADGRCVVMLRKLANPPAATAVVSISNTSLAWLEPLKAALAKEDARVVLVCQGEENGGLVGLAKCLMLETNGHNIRAVLVQDPQAPTFSLDHPLYATQLAKDLRVNVLRAGGVWGCFRHLPLDSAGEGTRSVQHAYITTLSRGDLSSLRWVESPLGLQRSQADTSKGLCSVYYAALNFKDVVLATGKLTPEAQPGDLPGTETEPGLEFAGRDAAGRRVMGFVHARSLATTVQADPDALWAVPDSWTLEQAATVPCCYATVYYALVVRGRMRRGESVLIHAGAGGVGQAAITLALHAGLTVFTTVGSTEKRAFLKKAFPQLSDDHIGSSRDAYFEQLVLEQTEGRGVDLVLNSLGGELLQASARCVAKHGRFLEIGKLDLTQDSALGMALFLRDAAFHGVALDVLFKSRDSDIKAEVVRLVDEGAKAGVVRPLPTTVFDDQQAEQAFRFLASAKHVGKVVLRIREEEEARVALPVSRTVRAVPRVYFHQHKSYVLVGGLGGVGPELARWMLTRGAKNLVLNSRSGVRSGYQAYCVRCWENAGASVIVSTMDCTTEDGARRLLGEAAALGPVGGIFNLAAVPRSGPLFDDLTTEDFVQVRLPRVDVTVALDRASRTLGSELDHFVFFSSLASGRGMAGEGNSAFVNSAVERLCETRRTTGLPCLAIQWGPIADVGGGGAPVAADEDASGAEPQRLKSCLAALDALLLSPHPVVSSVVKSTGRVGAEASAASALEMVFAILGIRDASAINSSLSLGELGMDSMMGTEVQQALERNFGQVYSPTEVRGITVASLIALDGGSDDGKDEE